LRVSVEAVRGQVEAQIPLGRYGTPEEFARVAVFGYDCAKLVLLPLAKDPASAFGPFAAETRDQGRQVGQEERHEGEQRLQDFLAIQPKSSS
jgi:NAD(P)-dependent dehydrogenase (short-subunit alcohol dehydrogenase family)